MVKTTVILEDDVYKKLAKEAVEKYGNMRTLSKLINEKLKESGGIGEAKASKKDIIEKTFGMWKMKESSVGYVRKLRRESEKRMKRLGL